MILRQIIFFFIIEALSKLQTFGSEFTKTVLPTLQRNAYLAIENLTKISMAELKNPRAN